MKNITVVIPVAVITAITIAAIAWMQSVRISTSSADPQTTNGCGDCSLITTNKPAPRSSDHRQEQDEWMGSVHRPHQPSAEIIEEKDDASAAGREGVEIVGRRESAATSVSRTQQAISSLEAAPATVGDPASPIILTDHHSWTIIGATASTGEGDRVQFREGIGIADRSGNWITAEQGDVVLANGAIAGVTLTGNATIRAKRQSSMAELLNTFELMKSGETRTISLQMNSQE